MVVSNLEPLWPILTTKDPNLSHLIQYGHKSEMLVVVVVVINEKMPWGVGGVNVGQSTRIILAELCRGLCTQIFFRWLSFTQHV